LAFKIIARTCLTWYGFAWERVLCKIDLLLHATLPEQVMAATHSLLGAQALEQMAQVVKTDGGISGPAELLAEGFCPQAQ